MAVLLLSVTSGHLRIVVLRAECDLMNQPVQEVLMLKSSKSVERTGLLEVFERFKSPYIIPQHSTNTFEPK